MCKFKRFGRGPFLSFRGGGRPNHLATALDRKQDEELNTRVGKASAVMQVLHYSVVMKRELSKNAKLSQFSKQFLSPFSLMVMNLG